VAFVWLLVGDLDLHSTGTEQFWACPTGGTSRTCFGIGCEPPGGWAQFTLQKPPSASVALGRKF
jgi:hypothetical protein